VPSDLFYNEIRLINFSFPHSESEFEWEVPLGLKFWSSEYLVIFKMQKCSAKVPSVLIYDEIRCTKLNKIVILPYFSYNLKMKLRLEVLFKKFQEILLSSYMEYIESIGITPKIFEKLFLLKSCFLPIKSHTT
jgi:hypothetical protein